MFSARTINAGFPAAFLCCCLAAHAQQAGGQQQVPLEQVKPKRTLAVAPRAEPAQIVKPAEYCPVLCDQDLGTSGWLMQQLERHGAGQTLRAAGIGIGGWLEQGFTWNPDSPDNRFNFPVTFNDRANEYQMNQLYLFIERPVDSLNCCWDIGGRVDLLYGTDYYFVESAGLELEQNGSQKWNSEDGPRFQYGPARLYGLAMPQAYLELFAPIGPGVSIKFGHFYTILGYESPMAPANFFYSHGLLAEYAEPYTHTGVLVSYRLTDQISVESALHVGWDRSSNADDGITYTSRVKWQSCDRRTTLAVGSSFGQDTYYGWYEMDRHFYNVIVTRQVGCKLTLIAQWDWGRDTDVEGTTISDEHLRFMGWEETEWYGSMVQAVYEISPCLSAGVRAEWMRDDDNIRIVPVGAFADGANYWEITAGLNYRPMPNLLVRPELRWDWSDLDLRYLGLLGAYDDFSDKNQFTLAVDAIVTF